MEIGYMVARRIGVDIQYWRDQMHPSWTESKLVARRFESYSEAQETIDLYGLNKSGAYVLYPDTDVEDDEEDDFVLSKCPNPRCNSISVGFVEGDTGRYVKCNSCGIEGPSGDEDGEIWNSLPRSSESEISLDPPKHIYVVWGGGSIDSSEIYDDEADAELACNYGAGEDVVEYTSEKELRDRSIESDSEHFQNEEFRQALDRINSVMNDAITELRVHFTIRQGASLTEAVADACEDFKIWVRTARQDAASFLREQVATRGK